jgi:hypothetical protein
MAAQTEHGYLVLADISGFTAFLAQVELDHAHGILADLLEEIVEQFRTMLTIHKLEGDAVFAFVSEARVPRPETLLELCENTYLAFRMRRETSHRGTTCTCRACQSIPSLDLKFFIHHGDYIIHHVAGNIELLGPDVTLVHRLSKNHITEVTGWKAYILFTQDTLDAMGLQLEGLHRQIETYEHLGQVDTLSLDLHPRYQALSATHRIVITAAEADLEVQKYYSAPVSLLWQAITDPYMLTQALSSKVVWSSASRPGGRTGVGARNHCAHGKDGLASLTYLDWRPLSYYTAELTGGKMSFREMELVEPAADGGGSILTIRVRMNMPLPHWMRKLLCTLMAKKNYQSLMEDIRVFLQEREQAGG